MCEQLVIFAIEHDRLPALELILEAQIEIAYIAGGGVRIYHRSHMCVVEAGMHCTDCRAGLCVAAAAQNARLLKVRWQTQIAEDAKTGMRKASPSWRQYTRRVVYLVVLSDPTRRP